ncbi:hypothetical protein CSPX01_07270 [Colletotrichum filicis]|nr:hypothetical protein CSPX01_07270 [Colletotrichum filicis]
MVIAVWRDCDCVRACEGSKRGHCLALRRLWCPLCGALIWSRWDGLFLALAAGIDWVEGSRHRQAMDDGMKSARSRRVSPIWEENNKRVHHEPIKTAKSYGCTPDWPPCPHPMKLGHPNSCAH